MKRLTALLAALLLTAGCNKTAPQPALPTPPAPPLVEEPQPAGPQPELTVRAHRGLSRDEVRDGLVEYMNQQGQEPIQKIRTLFDREPQGDEAPWLAADLDGNGEQEYVVALAVDDPPAGSYRTGQGAALFVIYHKDGRWAVDRSDPMDEMAELLLMAPRLYGVADLAGLGRPQIVWYRPQMIATGPQPSSVFVTLWEPGSFFHLPGEMSVSAMKLALDGRDLLLTGISRAEWFIRLEPLRTDRYRLVDGAFRLVDRRFLSRTEFGYDLFWDAITAEQVGRLVDAERDYRKVLEPGRTPHAGSYLVYKAPPRELTPAELESFGEALRAFARFRLGALLLRDGRAEEARAVLAPSGPHVGLVEAMRRAGTREEGCQAGAEWAAANPAFLSALNAGAGHSPWTPDLLCSHHALEDGLLVGRATGHLRVLVQSGEQGQNPPIAGAEVRLEGRSSQQTPGP